MPRGAADPVSALCALLAPGGAARRPAASATSCACTARARLRRAQGDPRRAGRRRAADADRDRAAPAPHAGLDQGLPVVAGGRRPDHVAAEALQLRRSAAAPLGAPPLPPDAADRRGHRARSARLRASAACRRPSPRSRSPARRGAAAARRAGASSRLIEDGQGRASRRPAPLPSCSPLRARHRLPVDQHLDLEPPPVRRADLRGQPVDRQAAIARLQPFLQRGLVVLGERRLGAGAARLLDQSANCRSMNARAGSMPPSR